MSELKKITNDIKRFAEERDWEQFHSPKNLAMALSAETGELLEEFQWLTEEESKNLDDGKHERVKDEIGDVLVYLLRLSSKLGIDPIEAANLKMIKNAKKYPVEKARGTAKKYRDL